MLLLDVGYCLLVFFWDSSFGKIQRLVSFGSETGNVMLVCRAPDCLYS